MKVIIILVMILFGFNNLYAQPNQVDKSPLILLLDQSEGGASSQRNLNKLQKYLFAQSCELQVNVASKFNSQKTNELSVIRFIPIEEKLNSINNNEPLTKLINIYSYLGNKVQTALVVRGGTTEHIDGIANEPISIVSKTSFTGNLDSIEISSSLKRKIAYPKMLASGNHMGALSLLLHKDAFATVIELGFARNWIDKNNLKLLATGKESKLAGVYANKKALSYLKQNNLMSNCIKAFESLDRNNKKLNRIFRVFPDWLVGFERA